MLPRNLRLRSSKEIANLGQRGRRWRGKYFTSAWQMRNGQSSPRFAFVISGKIARRAVKRNLLVRRLREAVYQELKEHSLRPADVVFYARRTALEAKKEQLQREVCKFLRKLESFKQQVSERR